MLSATELTKDVKVTEADARQYYEAHKNDFETVHAKHILIRFQGSPVPVRAGEKDLRKPRRWPKRRRSARKSRTAAILRRLPSRNPTMSRRARIAEAICLRSVTVKWCRHLKPLRLP